MTSNFKKDVGGVLKLRGFVGAKQKRKGFRKFVKWIFKGFIQSGDKLEHPLGINIKRIIDRENSCSKESYIEVIEDVKTGKITRNIKEPLKEHK